MCGDQLLEFRAMLYERRFTQSIQFRLTPLTGGVSSEIYLVEDGDRRFVVKRALEKLNVEADWFADTSRNSSEWAYIRYVSRLCPMAMPKLFHCDPEAQMFSMEYLEGFRNWKEDLLAGKSDTGLAAQAGSLLGKIHAHSWGDPQVKRDFDSMPNFDELRIDPYLRATAAKHPGLATPLLAEAERLSKSRQCLMHGDYSPKNMLYRGGRFIPLDCEVACYADAAFDLSFFLNHLFLKGLYHAPRELGFDKIVAVTRTAYQQANPEYGKEVEAQAARLLPMLMLARVDGKSPVEYLGPDRQNVVRSFVSRQLVGEALDMNQLQKRWFEFILS